MHGEPRVVEREGTPIVVDATGAVLVCRRQSPYAHGTYHRIECDRFVRDETMRPACRVTGGNDDNWRVSTRQAIEGTWEGCTYGACYGTTDHQPASTGPHLRTTLAEMSVAEFEAIVAAHTGGER